MPFQICPKLVKISMYQLRHDYTITRFELYVNFGSTDGTATTSFDETPLMSSYLIAFVVSDFPSKRSATKSGAWHRIFAEPAKLDWADLGLRDGISILNSLGNYLKVPFSLPKMDQVAVPDFGPGGKIDSIRIANMLTENKYLF